MHLYFVCINKILGTFFLSTHLGQLMMLALLISGMTIPEEDADVGQGSKYCLVAIGRLQVSRRPQPFLCRMRAACSQAQEPVGPGAVLASWVLSPGRRALLCGEG